MIIALSVCVRHTLTDMQRAELRSLALSLLCDRRPFRSSPVDFLLMFAPGADTLLQQPCRACAARRGLRVGPAVQAAASKQQNTRKQRKFGGLGDLLGPIGLTLGGKLTVSSCICSIV